MSDLRSLTNLAVEINSRFLGDWPMKVGSYMLNFASIELISYQYLNALEKTRDDFNRNLDKLLSQRINRILELVSDSSAIEDTHKNEIRSLWETVKELAVWRNRIAHNSVVPCWKPGSNSERNPPDLIGIIDMKQLKASNITDSISLEGLNILVDETCEVAERLHAAVKDIQK